MTERDGRTLVEPVLTKDGRFLNHGPAPTAESWLHPESASEPFDIGSGEPGGFFVSAGAEWRGIDVSIPCMLRDVD